MSPLRAALHDYLRIRRRLGFELRADGRLLERFVDFAERAGARHITTELALAWARQPQDAHPHRWRQRLGMVRAFARYVATIDPSSEVPAEDLLPATRQRVPPYIYSQDEIAALMQAARALTPPLRAATFETLIGLMATTGLRLGEALGLDRRDVDLDDGALHVRAAKQSKQREVPLHPTTTDALREYARWRDRRWPRPKTAAFFVSQKGQRLSHDAVHGTFPKLIREVGLVKDAEWLCQLAEAGLLRASFVPPKPIRALRNLTRYRKTQIQERAREANRLHKALEDTGIKLDCVATDILGKSGRAMLDALVSGTTDPEILAELARGKLRAKIPALKEALEGRFDHLHAVWIGAILAHLDFLDEQIAST